MIEKWAETMGTMTTFLLGIKEGSAGCMVLARAASLQRATLSPTRPFIATHTGCFASLPCLPWLGRWNDREVAISQSSFNPALYKSCGLQRALCNSELHFEQ